MDQRLPPAHTPILPPPIPLLLLELGILGDFVHWGQWVLPEGGSGRGQFQWVPADSEVLAMGVAR